MGRRVAGTRMASGSGQTLPVERSPASRWSPRMTRGAVAALGVLLAAVVAFAVTREISRPTRIAPPSSPSAVAPPRPAFTPAEETYIRALWPIHGDVERSTARLTL